MRRLGRFLVLLLLFTMLPAALPHCVLADGLCFYGDVVEVEPGEVFDYVVSIRGSTGIAAFLVSIEYDMSVFTCLGKPKAEALCSEGTLSSSREGGRIDVLWYDSKDMCGSGAAFSVRLAASEDAEPGCYEIKVSVSKPDVVNEELSVVPSAAEGGSVEVLDTAPPAQSFPDVGEWHWAFEYVERLYRLGVVDGLDGGGFGPELSLKRAELVKLLTCLMGEPQQTSGQVFEDVEPGDWYFGYVNRAAQLGIVTGVSETRFEPERAVTRQELCAMIDRALCVCGFELEQYIPTASFTDSEEIEGYARPAVERLSRAGLIEGYEDGSFRPEDSATRAEAAKLLYCIWEMCMK